MLVRMLPEGVAGGHIVTYRGMTPRNRTLLPRARARICSSWFMLNVSSETSGVGAGVLIRAIESTEGITIMKRNRGTERLVFRRLRAHRAGGGNDSL